MNRILVCTGNTPSPLVSTVSVPKPVLRGKTERVKATLFKSHDVVEDVDVALPFELAADVLHVRILEMTQPTIIVMESGNAAT
jgi:hypothetical protein